MHIVNFSSGPAMLPTEVMQRVQEEFRDWHHCGIGVMELSHRGHEFTQIINNAEAMLRELLGIPNNYRVLFLSGGATQQFSMVPMNLLDGHIGADYLNSGIWSKKAIEEAAKFCHVNVVASSEHTEFNHVPEQKHWKLNPQAAYVHITPNETIGGVEMFWTPQTGGVPLVADMSSTILSRPINVEEYGLIYAGAQKNIGPSGLTIVIIRDDLLKTPTPTTPLLASYKLHADHKSLYNTPNTFAIYVASLVFEWLHQQGGLLAIEQKNINKANLLYDYLAQTDFYYSSVAPENRSRMNVTFRLTEDSLTERFVADAEASGFRELRGHRSVGGLRASIYNAMPAENIMRLVDFMCHFEKVHG